MSRSWIRNGAYSLVLGIVVWACAVAPIPVASPRANDIEVAKADPPPGSANLGPIEAVHGNGCGGFGARGSFDGAMIVLRNLAAARKANYVSLLTTTPPHQEGGCYDNKFVIRAIAYRVDPMAVTASPAALSANDGCDPPCSPGYRCSKAVCLAVCNPTCAADQVCRQDRTCGPAEPAPPAP